MCKLYGIGEIDNPSLSSFPPSLVNIYSDQHLKVNMPVHTLWMLPIFIRISLKFVHNGNGNNPVDYSVVLPRIARLIGITEVKDKDFKQGIARNAVQCESVLASIVTDEIIGSY
ncbi:unnamed protein product [Rhizophagus irregularis]|nr:unnamed protein product [Rhizophagus irregularis]